MTQAFSVADRYVARVAELDPLGATMAGIAGHDHEMTDYSPDGVEARHSFERETLATLAQTPVEGDANRITKECMEADLSVSMAQHDAGEHLRALSVLGSPVQGIRMCFDLMPHATGEDFQAIAARLRLVPRGIAGYRESLQEGVRRGLTASVRQATGCAVQAEVWSGGQGTPPYFEGLVTAYDGAGLAGGALRRDLVEGARAAGAAYADLARFLRETYAPHAAERDAVGRDRYALHATMYSGMELDLEETYDWGWDQIAWVEREMAAVADRILPGGTVEEAKALLESDPARAIDGVAPFREWMQSLQDRTIEEMHGTHFDLAEPVRRIEALIAPPGGALAMYYTGPSEDFSRPGRTWYPTGGKTRFPLWGEVSIAYHEGVPGHHLQIATTKHLKDRLSRYQRLFAGTSGYVEGWGLYAERLMGELGYLENPDYSLGMLRAQALRCVRVVIDIGMHLELPIPKGQDFHPGAVWDPDLGLEMMRTRSHFPPDFSESEVSRYLGIPGQAISYKVGERAWLEAREAARERLGASFDLKAWHNRALSIGPMGLAQMRREMAGV